MRIDKMIEVLDILWIDVAYQYNKYDPSWNTLPTSERNPNIWFSQTFTKF